MARVSKDHIDKWFDYDLDIDNRTIYVGSIGEDENGGETGVDFSLSERVIKALHVLEKNAPSGDKPIHIILNNPGGEVIEGLAIYDAIRMCKNYVTITAMGKVWSMAGYILQAADPGGRIMAPNASFMLHEGTEAHSGDHPRIIKAWREFNEKQDKKLFELYLTKILEKHPDFKPKKLEEMLKFDTIMDAEETVELGLADKVLEYD